jgi:alginate export protein
VKFATVGLLLLSVGPACAQSAPPPSGQVIFSGSLRVRPEVWHWFEAKGGDSDYTYVGTLLRLAATGQAKRYDWQVELAAPWLAGLPTDSVAPPPEGALGLGATYRAANGGKEASLFPKQAFVRLHNVGSAGNALRLGRFEFIEGSEGMPNDPTLAALKRDRISHRLLGNFGWSHIGRSVDGIQFARQVPRLNLTMLAARPTQGVFELNGWDELDIEVYYAAATHPLGRQSGVGEGRLFWLLYRDHRDVLKVDNRPVAVRTADRAGLEIHTLGGHLLRTIPAGSGKLDLLLWGVAQFGDWGRQDHRAGAAAAEVGYQPKAARLHPWIRAGVNWGSGDGDPSDGKHETFFQVLPTPRIYARFPFYNQMNSTDWFTTLMLRPQARWSLRADYHNLGLSHQADLWYQGGGAYENRPSFGYVGRPSGGRSGLAQLLDVSVDYTVSTRSSLTLYAGQAFGGGVIESIYQSGKNASLLYLEWNQKL